MTHTPALPEGGIDGGCAVLTGVSPSTTAASVCFVNRSPLIQAEATVS